MKANALGLTALTLDEEEAVMPEMKMRPTFMHIYDRSVHGKRLLCPRCVSIDSVLGIVTYADADDQEQGSPAPNCQSKRCATRQRLPKSHNEAKKRRNVATPKLDRQCATLGVRYTPKPFHMPLLSFKVKLDRSLMTGFRGGIRTDERRGQAVRVATAVGILGAGNVVSTTSAIKFGTLFLTTGSGASSEDAAGGARGTSTMNRRRFQNWEIDPLTLFPHLCIHDVRACPNLGEQPGYRTTCRHALSAPVSEPGSGFVAQVVRCAVFILAPDDSVPACTRLACRD
ncbi:hypothetical protein B0H13DRAFT_1870289 [Mycena leptocephala]|nr:hypothetical protein B0H13DRAFT_1870289 [Mycena leptocephala]